MTVRALIVDDDQRLFELLADYLGQNDVFASWAKDGHTSLTVLAQGAFDVVLLDVMMPGIDGLMTLREIRRVSTVPVIMLTAKGDETDRVVGLELGADDYLAKPFSPRELLARIRAVLRRIQPPKGEKITLGPMTVDVEARAVCMGDESIDLTGLEFDILVALVRRVGRVVPRGALLELAGRNDVNVSDRTVDVHVSHLRKKLGDDPPRLIKTVRGVGYQVVSERKA
jgi:two-component system, OmpR family, response regulator